MCFYHRVRQWDGREWIVKENLQEEDDGGGNREKVKHKIKQEPVEVFNIHFQVSDASVLASVSLSQD